jgi:hypothetical protein
MDKMDTVGLGHIAWKASFSRVKTNIKVITSRGWGA